MLSSKTSETPIDLMRRVLAKLPQGCEERLQLSIVIRGLLAVDHTFLIDNRAVSDTRNQPTARSIWKGLFPKLRQQYPDDPDVTALAGFYDDEGNLRGKADRTATDD